MTRSVRIRPEAEADISDAYNHYEEAQAGIGELFLACISEGLDSLAQFPEAYPVVHEDVRRLLIRRFPFALFYFLEPDEIIVFACFHGRRDPSSWKQRRRR